MVMCTMVLISRMNCIPTGPTHTRYMFNGFSSRGIGYTGSSTSIRPLITARPDLSTASLRRVRTVDELIIPIGQLAAA
jgi:hypothetical protein